jgi:selenocysteine lyase/cysteine desulfurase
MTSLATAPAGAGLAPGSARRLGPGPGPAGPAVGPARAAGASGQLTRFLAAYPEYLSTGRLDDLRATQYSYLDAGGHVYLDYTGAGLPARSQLSEHSARLAAGCFGNPHSENPASVASTGLIEAARQAILAHFLADPDEYAVIFTQNASAACRLVGEAYPFGPGRGLVLTSDNHNSVNGIREFARVAGAGSRYVPFAGPDLRVDTGAVEAALRAGGGGLFAFPAQSNFSGVRHDLGWIEAAHERGYDVLLDAAAFAPSSRLDLSVLKPDFVPVSWYKVFGYPTGVGCLIARRSRLTALQRPWFAGGTVAAVSVQVGWHAHAADESRFEDGTLNFLHVPDVTFGLNWVNGIGLDVIAARVACLTGWMLGRLAAMRHPGGQPAAVLYGPAGTAARGGTVAFNLLDEAGQIIDAGDVGRCAGRATISVRTGCFCNPGAAEAAFGLSGADIVAAWQQAGRHPAGYPAAAGVGGGAIRASVGLASNFDDVETFLSLIETMYR